MRKVQFQHRIILMSWLMVGICWFLEEIPAFSEAQTDLKPTRWEKDIAKFEAVDRQSPPPQNAVLFVGSSSIGLWNLAESFPDIKTINRGFGGSFVEDSAYFADRIILPYHPRVIVFYAGDNDIASGKSPQQVLADYQAFVKKVHTALPQTTILYISIKPSMKRLSFMGKMRDANRLIQEFCRSDARLIFVDVFQSMLDQENRPRKELFLEDDLHLNAKGYQLWTSLLKPQIMKILSPLDR